MKKSEIKAPNIVRADKVALKIWEMTVPQLEKDRIISAQDVAVLVNYCTAYANAQRYELFVARMGPTYKVGKSDYTATRPEVTLARDAWKETRACADRLGLNPSARKKSGIESEEKDDFFD